MKPQGWQRTMVEQNNECRNSARRIGKSQSYFYMKYLEVMYGNIIFRKRPKYSSYDFRNRCRDIFKPRKIVPYKAYNIIYIDELAHLDYHQKPGN